MKAAFLALSLVGQPIPISDSVPNYDVAALCADVSADDKASGLSPDASKCVTDETAARQQLGSIWQTFPAGPRETCEILAGAGVQSYVELLTCLQMNNWDSPSASAPALRRKQDSKALGN
ncbi:hypothetical protein JQ633_13515 [Bradyrhizobium tropiciagri]|uniref:hypothetical protein n=1 Tax=Bradyrhizobium tropiciagri TaxID=312253 RepID=UPI001BA9C679|nr:hypothetical protein [Bradyrhizobium tropiciagri]MBR0871380.1 hypothetical protein [Bradyrhizobium tropiciagri]